MIPAGGQSDRPPVRWRTTARRTLLLAAGRTRRYLPLAGLPVRQRRARVLTAASAASAAMALAIVPLAFGGGYLLVRAGAGAAGLLLLLGTLAGWRGGIGWSVAFLAVDYCAGIASGSTIDPTAPVEAAGLLLVAELAAWSLECRTLAADHGSLFGWRLRRLAWLEAVALISGVAVLAAANLPAHGGTILGAIGMASAVAVLVLAPLLLRRLRRTGAGLGPHA